MPIFHEAIHKSPVSGATFPCMRRYSMQITDPLIRIKPDSTEYDERLP